MHGVIMRVVQLNCQQILSCFNNTCTGCLLLCHFVHQEAVATVLGICFRLFADPKNADSVVNTAATTVRQASHLWL